MKSNSSLAFSPIPKSQPLGQFLVCHPLTYIHIQACSYPLHTNGLILYIIFYTLILSFFFNLTLSLGDCFISTQIILPCSFRQLHRIPLYYVTIYLNSLLWMDFQVISHLHYERYCNEYLCIQMSFCTFVQHSYRINSYWIEDYVHLKF